MQVFAFKQAFVEQIRHLRDLERGDQDLGDFVVGQSVVKCLFNDKGHLQLDEQD